MHPRAPLKPNLVLFSFFVGVSMVGGNIRARPDFFLRPRFGGRGPKWIVRRQTQLQHSTQAQVKAAGGNVTFADARLMADRADLKPALCIECFRCFNRKSTRSE